MNAIAPLITDAANYLRTLAGEVVTYRRDGLDPVTLLATPGKTEFEVTDRYEMAFVEHSADFIVAAHDLGLTPQRGDQITRGNGDIHEVMRPDGDGDVYRNADHAGTQFRIHTRRIARGGAA